MSNDIHYQRVSLILLEVIGFRMYLNKESKLLIKLVGFKPCGN